jgi:redox-sensitive bicupin YhaK (pirin superfamily)
MIELIIDRRGHDLGGGFEVGRVLPFRKRRMVGPFIFFDHVGPVDLAPGIPRSLDVRPHPHIGLSTVTYLFHGAITHRDSLGFQQEIRPGEVNWMVAGSGITHSERFERAREEGAHLHGIQTWVALPKEDEETRPAFYHYEGADLPEWSEDGVHGRLVAGETGGLRARVKTHSPLFYEHWQMDANSSREAGAAYRERAVYVASGEVEVAGTRLQSGQMAVLTPGNGVRITALCPAVAIVLGGEPIGERFMFWNFVSSSKERLEHAKEDWLQQRMTLPVGDADEFMPLPE